MATLDDPRRATALPEEIETRELEATVELAGKILVGLADHLLWRPVQREKKVMLGAEKDQKVRHRTPQRQVEARQ